MMDHGSWNSETLTLLSVVRGRYKAPLGHVLLAVSAVRAVAVITDTPIILTYRHRATANTAIIVLHGRMNE